MSPASSMQLKMTGIRHEVTKSFKNCDWFDTDELLCLSIIQKNLLYEKNTEIVGSFG